MRPRDGLQRIRILKQSTFQPLLLMRTLKSMFGKPEEKLSPTYPYGLIATVLPETSSQFKTKKLTLGGVYRTKYVEFNIFHTNLDLSGGTYQFRKNFWHGGVKVPVKQFDLYGGLYDGEPSYGIGYHHGEHSLTIAASKQNQVFSPTAGWSYYAEYSFHW